MPGRSTAGSADGPARPDRRRRRVGVSLLAAIALLATLVAVIRAHRSPAGSDAMPIGMQTVWEDDFAAGTVSRANWNVRNDTYNGNEESVLTSRPSNVRVSGGLLHIIARREQRTVGATTRAYTSGYLDTIGKHSWQYGLFEVRARLPLSQGMWPAFWLRTDRGPGEIDIMEAIGGRPDFAQQAVQESTMGGAGQKVHKHTFGSGSVAQWHVYGAWVEPDAITWFIDGRRVFRVTGKQAPWLHEDFDEPVNIRLNLQVGGTLPRYYHHSIDESTVLPAAYEIDWVRVEQKR